MAQSFFITATGTDVGKTYVTGLLLKAMRQKGIHAGYYKAALSGAEYVDGKRIPGDAYAVKETAQLEEPLEEMVSYVYDTAVSPHLATKLEGNPPELAKIQADFQLVQSHYDSVLVEGSGGLVCPLRWDDTAHILLEDVITMLKLPVLLVADAGLGTLNTVTLTAHYAREKGIDVKGVLLNRFHPGNLLEEDNRRMVEELTGLPVLAVIGEQSRELTLSEESWQLLKGVC